MTAWIDDFRTYLEERLGDSLRTLGLYDHSSIDLVYARDDIPKAHAHKRLQTIHSALRGTKVDTEPLDQLGPSYSTVQIREQAIILNVQRGERKGVIFSVEPDVGRNLRDFVRNCSRQIGDA